MFLVINLCTDNEAIIEYYDDLDRTLGNEMSGIDVIDDFEAEAKQVRGCGNSFFVYSYALHLARMAGCHSVIADQMDEIAFPLSYMNKCVKELLTMPELSLNISERQSINLYLDKVKQTNDRSDFVYDFLTKKFSRPIHIHRLKNKLYRKYYRYLFHRHFKIWVCCLLVVFVLITIC